MKKCHYSSSPGGGIDIKAPEVVVVEPIQSLSLAATPVVLLYLHLVLPSLSYNIKFCLDCWGVILMEFATLIAYYNMYFIVSNLIRPRVISSNIDLQTDMLCYLMMLNAKPILYVPSINLNHMFLQRIHWPWGRQLLVHPIVLLILNHIGLILEFLILMDKIQYGIVWNHILLHDTIEVFASLRWLQECREPVHEIG